MKSNPKLEQALENWGNKEVEVPDVVVQKMEDMLGKIAVEQEKKRKGERELEEKVVAMDMVPKKRKRWRYAVAAASFILAGLVTTYYTSAAFQDLVHKILPVTLDKGFQKADESGLVEKKRYQVTDNGVTIEIQEVMADQGMIKIVYDAWKDNGEKIGAISLDAAFLNRKNIQAHDAKTKRLVVVFLKGWGVANDSENRDGKVSPDQRGIITFQVEDTDVQKIILKLHVKHIRPENGKRDLIEGDWRFTIPIDFTKSQTLQNIASGGTYQAPDGNFLIVSKLDLRPSHTILTTRSKYVLNPNGYNYPFEILDDKGNVIYSNTDDQDNDKQVDRPVYMKGGSGDEDPKTGDMVFEGVFTPFPTSSFYTFRLKGNWLPVTIAKTFPLQKGTKMSVEGAELVVQDLYIGADGQKTIKIKANIHDGYDAAVVSIGNENGRIGPFVINKAKLVNGSIEFNWKPEYETPHSLLHVDRISKGNLINWETKLIPQPAK
ncbi:DUF4179 domain-containing protein [Risungbinella massiliensis]|uniref:DUF4179 domain-containing protein n=1 Tax=Risungbinella massiliensis TaxID=1329796 RepID=UPI0005CB9BB6|nr:DUF4179 domain-containing protein [Risungbinella massiliensis]